MTTFADLALSTPVLNAITRIGYEQPSPIQAAAIPHLLEGKDILGTAQTGTGKTAAFTLPILQQLMRYMDKSGKRPVRVLILTPTRELAIQIGESITSYGTNIKLYHTVIFGGVGQRPQTDALKRGVDIITATPGRLLDLMNQGFIDLKNIEHFVLDEADRMLDMGFIHDVKKVIAKIPKKRQTLFFSATMPNEVVKLSDSLLNNPIRVSVAPVSTTAEKVQQKVFKVDQKAKRFLLRSLLKDNSIEIPSVLVFTRTKHGADKVVKDLVKNGITAQAIHGNKSQNARQNALRNFKSRETRVLVATDIAARGIDIDELTHVINYEIPNIPETYVHRIGRTGRAGNSGIAWSFVDKEESKFLKDIQRLIKKEIPVQLDHEFLPGAVLPETEKSASPREGNRDREDRNFRKKTDTQKVRTTQHSRRSQSTDRSGRSLGSNARPNEKERDTSYWGNDSSGSGGAFTKPKKSEQSKQNPEKDKSQNPFWSKNKR